MRPQMTQIPQFSLLSLTASSLTIHAEENLKDAYKNIFKVGFAVNDAICEGKDDKLQDVVVNHANTITLEHSIKAEVIAPKRGLSNFSLSDQFVRFGQKHNMFIVDHTLVWHNQTPDWLFTALDGTPNTPKQQLVQMKDYIKNVASHYQGKVQAWDVVHEIIGDDGNYRDTLWVKSIGDGDTVVKAAFSYAEQFSPNTELYYNDFNAWRPEKVKGLNVPKRKYIENAINAYAALGLTAMLTELDVDVLPITKEGQVIGQSLMDKQFQLDEFKTFLDPYQTGLSAEAEQRLADHYRTLFSIFHSRKEKIDRVTFWGVNDSMSWKNNYPVPNSTNYPLLWNRNLTAKPALDAVLKLTNL